MKTKMKIRVQKKEEKQKCEWVQCDSCGKWRRCHSALTCRLYLKDGSAK